MDFANRLSRAGPASRWRRSATVNSHHRGLGMVTGQGKGQAQPGARSLPAGAVRKPINAQTNQVRQADMSFAPSAMPAAGPGSGEQTSNSSPPVPRAVQSVPTWHLFRSTPSWLISALAHTGLLIACAMITVSNARHSTAVVIRSLSDDRYVEPDISPPLLLKDPVRDDTPPQPNTDAQPDIALELKLPAVDPSTDVPSQFGVIRGFGDAQSASLKAAGGARSGEVTNREGHEGTQFCGIQAQGNRFAFIVDSSTSMRFKFADALRELTNAVQQLGPEQKFYVIFFDRDAERLRLGSWNLKHTRFSLKHRPESDFVAATPDNLHGLLQWMNTIQLEPDTNPYSAVVFAIKKLKPDAIFLLSDGEFHDGGSTESFLLHENLVEHPTDGPQPKTIVHCVGFYSREGEVTLRRIATANRGTYRFVAPPPGFFPVARPAFHP